MKVLSGNEKADFHKALDELSKKMDFHGALKAGFDKLYGYTNDEKGIRHSLLVDESKVDRNDALFMLSACGAFTSFLINKARDGSLLSENEKAA